MVKTSPDELIYVIMEREYTRYPPGATNKERRTDIERRIRDMRLEKKRAKRRGRSPVEKALHAVLVLLLSIACVYLLISTLAATVRAASHRGDTSVYTEEITPKNIEELKDYVEGGGGGGHVIIAPQIDAKSAVLMDPDTGQFLFEMNPDLRLPNASTTKILTGIIVLENCGLGERVTISRRAAQTPEQSIWLQEGETLTVEQLLYAMLLRSANDASVALAEHVAGSVEAFAKMMNEKAVQIGAANSNFVTPNGLHDPQHYTTARDLALIGAYCMRNQDFRRIVTTEEYSLPPSPGNQWERVSSNHNKLLKIYGDANGIKTGYTVPAGKCLVGSAERGERRLIGAVLNGGEDYFQDVASLFDYGFDGFTRVIFARAGEPVFDIEVGYMPTGRASAVARDDLFLTVRKDKVEESVKGIMEYRRWADYPLDRGQGLGRIIAEAGDFTAEVELVAQDGTPAPAFTRRIWSFLEAVLTFGAVSGLIYSLKE